MPEDRSNIIPDPMMEALQKSDPELKPNEGMPSGTEDAGGGRDAMTTYWITEEVLKYGIREAYGKPCSPEGIKCQLSRDPHSPIYWVVYKDAHQTLAAAQARAEFVRQQRITSLERQLARLRARQIAVVPIQEDG